MKKSFYCDKKKAKFQGRMAEQERVFDNGETVSRAPYFKVVREEEINGKVYRVFS